MLPGSICEELCADATVEALVKWINFILRNQVFRKIILSCKCRLLIHSGKMWVFCLQRILTIVNIKLLNIPLIELFCNIFEDFLMNMKQRNYEWVLRSYIFIVFSFFLLVNLTLITFSGSVLQCCWMISAANYIKFWTMYKICPIWN